MISLFINSKTKNSPITPSCWGDSNVTSPGAIPGNEPEAAESRSERTERSEAWRWRLRMLGLPLRLVLAWLDPSAHTIKKNYYKTNYFERKNGIVYLTANWTTLFGPLYSHQTFFSQNYFRIGQRALCQELLRGLSINVFIL